MAKLSGIADFEPITIPAGETGKSWDTLKEKTRKSIVKLAKDLIELYARRSVVPGYAFAPDSPLQKEFEEKCEPKMKAAMEKVMPAMMGAQECASNEKVKAAMASME